ncbi:ABC transporter substrate-binding protein [Symbiobacterium terraclitae]|uniref:ABC transporter substrate-binding protein n=1 Tax=Symbiobacterium terraclitae TaxID=557451 RepID=UPI0035B50BD2
MRRTPRLLAAMVLSLSLLLSACGGGKTQPPAQQGGTQQPTNQQPAAQQPTNQQPAPAEKVTIRLATWAGAEEAKELQAVIDKINAEATDYQIVHEPAPADYYTKIQTMFAGGTAPDLLWLAQEYVVPYAAKGALMDITDRLAKDSRPAANLDDYFPMVLEHAQYQGRTYGLPWIAQPVIVYYNEALFDEKGLPYPTDDWTWEEFRELAVKLTDKERGIYGTTFNGWPPVHMFIWQAGGEVISPDLKSSPIDSPEAIKALEFYSSIIYNEEVAPAMATLNEQGFGEMFKAGKIAMFFGGAADDLDRVEGLRVGHVKVPKGPVNQTTFAWAASTAINAKTKYPDQAYDALVALTEGIHNWKIVPPRKSMATAEQIVKNEPRKAKGAQTIMNAAPDMRAFRIIPNHPEWDTIFWEQLQDPLYNKKGSAAELAGKARAALEEVLP